MTTKWWPMAALACAVAVPVAAHVGNPDSKGYYWVDDREEGHELIDARYDNATPLPLVGSATAPVKLPFVMTLYGRAYDHAEATSDGRVVLRWLGSEREMLTDAGYTVLQRTEPRADVAVLDVFGGVQPGRDASIVFSQAGTQVSFRWVSFEMSPREPLTFEAQLRADGAVRYQYWSVRPYLVGPNYGRTGRIALNDPTGGTGVVVMERGTPVEGFDLRPGGVVEFPIGGLPGRDPVPHAVQCPPAFGLPADFPDWCERTAAGPDRIPGNGDENPDCTVNVTDGVHTPCNQISATEWLFREGGDYCANCAYTFYVRVDCGTDMHMPTADVEAMQVQITDMNTGLPRIITAENQCAKRRDAGDPYAYCDLCALANVIFPKDEPLPAAGKPAGSCNTTFGPFPELPCIAYRETGTTVAWGTPLDQVNPDSDGSGFVEQDEMDTPPCTTCAIPPCTCGTDTNANRVTELQNIDVILAGTPTLTGVYRLDIFSGGLEWQLYTNCDGSNVPQYAIYDRCDNALRDYNPLPQLFMSGDPATGFGLQVVDSSGCPATLRIAVTMCNVGGAPTASAPFTIRYQNAAGAPVGTPFEGDIATATDCVANAGLPLDSDECRTCFFDVAPGTSDLTAIIEVDRNFLVAECSEDPTAVRCTLAGGERERRIPVCSASCLADAVLTVDGSPFCPGQAVPLDANRSVLSGCAGTTEYQYEVFDTATSTYSAIPGGEWSATPRFSYLPAASGVYRVRVVIRCSTDTGCTDASASVTFEVSLDSDGDLIGDDCGDNCPTVANPGQEDAEADFVGDICDNCPTKFNPAQENDDADTFGNECDNCRFDDNELQENSDTDTLGDVCDNCRFTDNNAFQDLDGDGFPDPATYGEEPQSDLDADLVGDLCDNCPTVSNPLHLVLVDCNGDGDQSDPGEAVGEQCDQDGDGVGDACDNCRTTANPRNDLAEGFDCDGDGVVEDGPGEEPLGEIWLGQCDGDTDGIGNPCDNCPNRANPTQADSDEDPPGSGTPRPDGVGNACDNCPFDYNPVHAGPFDCDGSGAIDGPDEVSGVQCNVCTGCAFGPPEVLAGLGGAPHLFVEKATESAAVLLTSQDTAGDYTAILFGTPLTPGFLEKFNVYRGTLASLRQPGPITDPSRYDHAGDLVEGCGVTDATARVEPRPLSANPARGIYDAEAVLPASPNYYYLVVGACAGTGGVSVDGEYGFASPDGDDRSQPIPPSLTLPCP